MLGLVGFHEGGENVQLVSGLGAGLCIHQVFDAKQRTLMIPLGFDRRNIHGFCTLSDGLYIDLVILLMGQVVCFGLGALVGLPVFFLTKGAIGVSMAAALMIVIMLPFFLFAMFERNGQPLEVLLKHYIQARFIRPRTRVFETENFYATLEQNTRNRREVRKILHGKEKRKA